MSRGLKAVAIFIAFAAIYTLSRHAISSTTTTTTSSTTSSTTTSLATTTTTSKTTCLGSDFSGAFNQGQGAAGTIYASITLTKNSGAPCTVDGWPQLTLQDKTGGVLALNEVRLPGTSQGIQFSQTQANQPPTLLHLQQGSSTTFALGYNDVQVGNTSCVNAVTISVQFQAGASAVAVTPSYPIQPCDNGRVWVSPFF
ncbi:MAG: DUF4232 domain-containing protein [Acidimicrobiaceae bacterium]|nr:DUF4232 domain-containing protein [Acidimicrobiaceae bacterium]